MSTTALIAELLVVGMPATVLSLFVLDLVFNGNLFVWVYNGIKDAPIANSAFLLSVAYGIGIAVDRVAAICVPIISTSNRIYKLPRLGAALKRQVHSALTDSRIRAYKEDQRLYEYLEFTLARVRIARGHFLSFAAAFILSSYCALLNQPILSYPNSTNPLKTDYCHSSTALILVLFLCLLLSWTIMVVLLLSYVEVCEQADNLLAPPQMRNED